MKSRRVVVTGMGVVSPIGIGLHEFWDGLKCGRNGVDRISRFDPSDFRSQMAGEVRDFDYTNWIDEKSASRMDRFTHFGMAAAVMAMEDAGLAVGAFDGTRAGVIIGSGIGGAETIEKNFMVLQEKGPKGIPPLFVTKVIINTAASMVSIRFGLKGPLSALSVACSTGSNAIGEAFRTIQRGGADIMVAGGAEACLTPLPFAGFCASRSLSTRNDSPRTASRPFDRNRDGFVMGEGAGIVVLESLDHAARRDAKIYAELTGYGNTADAFHVTAPDPKGDGMKRVMRAALEDAGVRPEDVPYINAHGTSTTLNDKIESASIIDVFGEHAWKLKVSSIKSMTGHLLAGSGAVEFIAAVMSVHTDILPPTINYEVADPECPLDYVTKGAEKVHCPIAVSNSFGFGGGNACLVVKKHVQ